MSATVLTDAVIKDFRSSLICREKSPLTIEKYIRDARAFARFLGGEPLTQERTLGYKAFLMENGDFADTSINSMLSSLRALFRFLGRTDCNVSNIRIQEMPYCPEERSLSAEEYQRLLIAAGDNSRLSLLLKVLSCTGIRISELKYFTVEAINAASGGAHVTVRCKKKNRRVLVAEELRREIVRYIRENDITSGPVFQTRSGRPMNRSNIWRQMKCLGAKADVSPGKVFPHNLRKLFARVFYEQTRDIVQLACLLGHSSINTTRIYVRTTEERVRRRVEQVAMFWLSGNKKTTTLST